MDVQDSLTAKIIGCCFKVHSSLGPGFSERIYQNALKLMLKEGGLSCETEQEFPVFFHNKRVDLLKLDLLVNGSVIVEIKAITGTIPEVFKYQLLSYLKVSNLHVGLLVNFGNRSCQVKRFVL